MGTIRGKTLFDSFRQFRVRAPYRCAWVAALGILLWVLSGPAAVADANVKNVLVVYSSTAGDPHFVSLIEPAIRARVREPIVFYSAFLVDNENDKEQKSYLESQAETFRHEYANMKLDLVIADSPLAVYFALEYRNKIFPDTPIVFIEVSEKEFGGRTWPGVTGMTIPDGIKETLDVALRLHADAKTVAVISGPDPLFLPTVQSDLLRRKVRTIYFVEPPSRELIEKVNALPPHTVALFQLPPQDARQPALGTYDVLDAVTQRVPTYSEFPTLCLNHGCIGGAYGDGPKQDASIVELAARVLAGERPDDIPVVHNSNFQITFDWRALQRWHIPESALPPGSVILYRPPTFWEQYRNYIIAAVVVMLIQALMIAGLLWQRARKRKAEAVLRESEKRFQVMADSTPSLVWMCDRRGRLTYLNERRMAFTGPDLKAGYGDSWVAYVHPDDVKGILDRLAQALKERQPFSMEYRLRRSDGVHRWMFDVASPRMNGDGSFAGFIGSAIDVTDQKLAQQALENVSGQLIEAQENERSRIARDLHDDICQRLALLSMEIEQANRSPNGSPKNLEEIRKHCSEIAGDVQSLSHELHSSKLDYLGVVAAIRGFCSEFSIQHKVSIAFTDSNVPGNLPKDISLCLFRVTQEALHNAVKYSGTNQFTVRISGTADEVKLEIRDAGTGFDVTEAKRSRGLGLVSMQERVHLVHGRFSVEAQPGMGTKVLVVVPFAVENGPAAEGDLSKEASVTRIA